MQRIILSTLVVAGLLAMIPFACVARSRSMRSTQPRVHLVPDMDNQSSYKAQQTNPLFADRRSMRPPVPGTVARGGLQEDAHYHRGLVNDDYATTFPMPLTNAMMERGQDRYNIYCTPCHGLSGYGDGMVSRRAEEKQQGTWVPPLSFHDGLVYERPVGHLFNSITNGIRTMPAYKSTIPAEDRWAIVAYIKALQRSQRAAMQDVPPANRSELQ